ncbi:uncharacterized protein [Dermacentor albipictus]|uniref:uncharacterized protein isoform X2 n=1 Tax=Dermacentor albipictus TaxID=60249 RepID=UPI0038FC0E6A
MSTSQMTNFQEVHLSGLNTAFSLHFYAFYYAVMSAIYNCSEKYEYYLPEEFFKRVKSDWFVEEAWRCIDDSTPTREAARGCDSEVAMTIMAHCIRAHMFEIAVCMAEFLQRPLAYLQRAFQSTM